MFRTAELYLSRTKSQELIIRLSTLVLIYLLAFSIRLVSAPDCRTAIGRGGPAAGSGRSAAGAALPGLAAAPTGRARRPGAP
jgi:hypothetical protein